MSMLMDDGVDFRRMFVTLVEGSLDNLSIEG